MLIGAALLALVSAVLWIDRRHPAWMRRLPAPLWCYFLPMCASTLGWLPHQSPVYAWLSTYALPACLVMLLLSTDVRAILALGPVVLGVMAAGTAGIMLGGPIALALFQRWLPAGTWMGVGALSGSWIGGSANMVAVKEALDVPAGIFTPMIVVDTLLAYTWMGCLIWLAGWQPQVDRWLNANPAWLERVQHATTERSARATSGWSGMAMAIAAGLAGIACVVVGRRLPADGWLTARTWTVLLATTVGVAWSCHRGTRLRAGFAANAGTFLLYLLLASIGASADLRSIAQAPLLLALGGVWLLIHGLVLLVVGKFWRVPVFFLATVSQADVGGVASAPIVASVYRPSLAPVGLLLAVLGNVAGTYLGLATAALCRFVAAAYGAL